MLPMTIGDVNINSPVRTITARVRIYGGESTLQFTQKDRLKSFTVERVADEGKFFGVGVSHKLNLKLIDVNRELNITTANYIRIAFNYERLLGEPANFTLFYVSEVHRDENTNELSITAYDKLYQASNHTVSELNLTSYTIREFAEACAGLLGISSIAIYGLGEEETCFDTSYPTGANFDGTETIRQALNAIADATQTVYYLDTRNILVFKRLTEPPVFTIDKSLYFTLSSKTNRRLKGITHATELGDNVAAAIDASGTIQNVWNNPFWDLRDDISTLLDNAVSAVGGFTINQFECEWRGNYLVEIGDCIGLITKDDKTAISYLLNDTLTYDGTLHQQTQWSYTVSDTETDATPTNLGEALNKTFAKVDKVNREVAIVASETAENSESISSIIMNTESINNTVQSMKETTDSAIGSINETIATISNKVEQSITAEDMKITIESELANGVNSITTSTGFTFNEDGLSVSRSDSEMKTQITEDGMTVSKNDEVVLTANNVGVNAVNLHATTYLIIGTNSRFEDYGDNRTGCFWIGGE